MNKKILIIAILAILGTGGGVIAYSSNQKAKKQADSVAMEKKSSEELAMKKDKEAAAMAKEKEGDAMKKDGVVVAMSKGIYTSYDPAKLAGAEHGKVVLFFHAPWCPTCREANKNFEAAQAPDGLTLLKVDYDNSGELKKKYGITYQHTYVQVDKDGNLLKKWSGSTNYDEIKAQEI